MIRKLPFASLIALVVVLSTYQPCLAEEGGEHHHDEGGGDHEEGVVSISSEAFKTLGVTVHEANSATLMMVLKVNGRITPVSSKVAHIAPRFAGIIREVSKDVGETVEPGEVLAIVESNTTLQGYEVKASKSGLITERHATVGESVQSDEPLFTVMDLGQVWAEFTVFQRDADRVTAGQEVTIKVSGVREQISGKLAFVSPVVDVATQSRTARAVIPNPSGKLAPGAFITGQLATGSYSVPVAVREDAIQNVEGKSVIFLSEEGGRFKVQEIVTGRSDGTLTEVTKGLRPGVRYAAGNSFLLKAELGKAEAEHDD